MKHGMIRTLRHGLRALGVLASNPLVVRDIVGALSRGAFDDARRMAYTAQLTPDLRAEKIVSRKYRFLWMCNPKVASRSIISALQEADPDAEIIRGKNVSDVYARYPEVRDYYSFAFIRHPFARALSFHREIHFSREVSVEQRRHKLEKRRQFFDRFHGLAETGCFDDYCLWLNTPYGSDAFADRHFLSQHVQIRLEDGRLPDFIGHVENIEADLNRVAEHVNMPVPALPTLNTMAGWQTTPDVLNDVRSEAEVHLTEPNKALLRTRYERDLELWMTHRQITATGDSR